MPQYLIAGYMPDDFDPSSVTEAMGRAIHAFNKEMEDAGVLKLACGLGAAKSLRAQTDGKVLVTDGPYLETKEHIGGLYILECADLARSAAPESISRDAEVQVLGRHGFETAVKGKNGFVCIVGRSWTSAADADFWDPKVRVPMCVNAAAARSYLLRITKIAELALAGRTLAQVNEAIAAAIAKKELPPMEPGAMCYMMSKQGYGGDSAPHWPSHLMLFFSQTDPATWGANLPG